MVNVRKAELDAIIESAQKLSRDLSGIVAAVRDGNADAEVEITAAIVNLNAMTDHLRAIRRREIPSPTSPRHPLQDH